MAERGRVVDRWSRAVIVLVAAGALAACTGAPREPGRGDGRASSIMDGSDPFVVGMVPTVGRAEVEEGIRDGSVTIVDTLPEAMHAQRRLPGAVNIPGYPYEDASANTERLAPTVLPDKSAPIILYCLNVPCRNSEFVGRRLMAMNYTSVRKYPGGMEDWLHAGLRTEGTVAG